MTLRQLGEYIIWLGGVAVALAAIGVLLRWLVVRPLKNWIVEQTQPAQAAAKQAAATIAEQVTPNGGTQETTRHLIEQTAKDTASLVKRVDEIALIASESRDLANTALTIAKTTSERLDQHLTGHSLGG